MGNYNNTGCSHIGHWGQGHNKIAVAKMETSILRRSALFDNEDGVYF